MRIRFIGTGTGQPDGRVQSCILLEQSMPPVGLVKDVEVGGRASRMDLGRVLVDCGPGSHTALGRIPGTTPDEILDSIQHVFITHNHMDHNLDLMPLAKGLWLSRLARGMPLPVSIDVTGPGGTFEFVEGIDRLYSYLSGKVVWNVQEIEPGWNNQVAISNATSDPVIESDGLVPVCHIWWLAIDTAASQHSLPGVSYLFREVNQNPQEPDQEPDQEPEYRAEEGRKPGGAWSLLITGDTYPCQGTIDLLAIARGKSDRAVLVHEFSLPDVVPLGEAPSHTRPVDMLLFMKNLDPHLWPDTLVLVHLYPPLLHDGAALESFKNNLAVIASEVGASMPELVFPADGDILDLN